MHRSVNPDSLIRNILPWKPKQARPDAVIYALHYTALSTSDAGPFGVNSVQIIYIHSKRKSATFFKECIN